MRIGAGRLTSPEVGMLVGLIHEPALAITVDIDGPRYEQRRPLLADVVNMYDHLLEVALPPADSLARIRHHLRSHQ